MSDKPPVHLALFARGRGYFRRLCQLEAAWTAMEALQNDGAPVHSGRRKG